MPEGKWWFITCTTFGTWLPGDPRGFQTWRGRRYVPPPKRYAKPGEQTYCAVDYTDEYQATMDALSEGSVHLSTEQRNLAVGAIVADVAETTVYPAILSLGDVHLHFLAKFGSLRIRATMGRFKAAATDELHQHGLESKRVWTRGCHMKSKPTRDESITAFRYIRRHKAEDCVVHIWEENIPDDYTFLIPRIPLDDLPF